jgi:sporulation protein YlmC with PRC-barrel domain
MNTTSQSADQLVGYDVLDSQGNKIGSVDSVWLNGSTNEPEFIGVKTTWLVGKTHVVPLRDAQMDDGSHAVQLPYDQDVVKGAPTYDPNAVLTQDQQSDIYSYYENAQTQADDTTVARPVRRPSGMTGLADAVTGSNSSRGSFPVDDVTYDLYTLIHEKLKGLEAFDQYLEDANGDQGLSDLLTQLRDQDSQAVQMLQQFLVQRLPTGSTAGS